VFGRHLLDGLNETSVAAITSMLTKDGGLNLLGGLQPGLDPVQYAMPAAYSITMLSWAVTQFGKGLNADQQAAALATIRWMQGVGFSWGHQHRGTQAELLSCGMPDAVDKHVMVVPGRHVLHVTARLLSSRD
jgi:hypothetical protein